MNGVCRSTLKTKPREGAYPLKTPLVLKTEVPRGPKLLILGERKGRSGAGRGRGSRDPSP